MITTMRSNLKSLFSRRNSFFLIVNFFWYLALFPGRLGFDNALALTMIRDGDTTDWWTGTFWRILQITTFQGKTIAVLSLMQILLLSCSILFFVNSFSKLNQDIAWKSLSLFCLTPIYGFFALSISHDVFQTSALLLLVGYFARLQQRKEMTLLKEMLLLLIITVSISTVKTGVFFSVLLLIVIFKFCSMKTLKASLVFGVTLILAFILPRGLDPSWSQSGKFTPFLGDMKCIAQHPDAQISTDSWKFLENISSRASWTTPVSCSGLEAAVQTLNPNFGTLSLDRKFIEQYLRMIISNPEIFVMGHIVRSREALPPLLFPAPENQVSFDFSLPLGQGTNAELQSGPPLLHPSIDSSLLDQRVAILKPLEMLVQFPAFLINQASWFWGWAGLWLTIGIVAIIRSRAFRTLAQMIFVLSPIFLLHLIVLAIGFNPQGRHLMASIFIGIYFGIYTLLRTYWNFMNPSPTNFHH